MAASTQKYRVSELAGPGECIRIELQISHDDSCNLVSIIPCDTVDSAMNLIETMQHTLKHGSKVSLYREYVTTVFIHERFSFPNKELTEVEE